ncbi:MAG: hypothetical protein Q7V01_06345 [Vicinamibacterales bacterium]|nr:hypothetical protein [Vicinamibacterales bacterium]
MVRVAAKTRQAVIRYNQLRMNWFRWFLVGLVAGLGAIAGWRAITGGAESVGFDFAAQVESASVRRPAPEAFAVRDIAIGGVVRRAITVDQPSRIAWDFTLDHGARLEVFLALQEDAWTRSGDGVVFRVGISYDGRYEELLTQVVAPQVRAEDRRWVPVTLDLTPFAGRAVSVIFNTGAGPDNNRENDLAVWGAPVVMSRR